MSTSFDRAIAVEPVGDNLFRGEIDLGWSAPMGPNGGYLAAIALNALQRGIDPSGERRIRSLTCHYLRRPAGGEIEIRIEPIRSGRRLATGRLSGFQNGKEVLAAIGAFAAPALDDVATWTPYPPDVPGPPPEDAPVVPASDWKGKGWFGFDEGAPTLLQHMLLAPRRGGRPYAGTHPKPGEFPEAGGWILPVEERPIDAEWVALCTDVWWPPSLEPLTTPAGVPTIDLTIHFRADLPPEGLPRQPLIGMFRSTAAVGGLVEEDGVVFSKDGTLLAQSRQLALFTPLG